MSSLGYANDAAAGLTAGYGAFNSIKRAIKGDARRTRFVRGDVDLVQFDVVLNESHNFKSDVTTFPVQYGSQVTDFISVAPQSLQIQALVTDTPIETKSTFEQQAIIASANAVASTLASGLGVVGVAATFMALQAQQDSTSRSVAAFNTITQLCIGGIVERGGRQQVIYPQPFDVSTYLRTYRSMVLTGVSVGRDNSTGSGIVFAMELQEVRLVSSFEQDVTVPAQPDRATAKRVRAEQEAENKLGSGKFKEGRYTTDDAAGVKRFDAAGAL